VDRRFDLAASSDEALLAALAGSDADGAALGELERRYRPEICSWVRRRHADAALADEVVAETFQRLWRRRDRFDPARGTAAAWLFILARSALADALRTRRRHPVPVERMVPADDVADQADRIVAAAVVDQLLDHLSAEQRHVVVLAFVDGLTQREIAERLDIPLGTVKTRSFHGLRALRRAAEDLGIPLT